MFEIAHADERELLMQVASGDEHAFRQLFTMHHQQLGVHMLRITNSIELAEEVVQDVFLKIWFTRESLVRVDNFKAYLFVISKNHALNCLKKLAKERAVIKQLEEAGTGNLHAEIAGTNMYYNLLDEAIDQLPPQQQKVYLLSRHGRLKYAEIADQMELSRETVKKYLQIATLSITEYVHEHLEVIALLLIALKSFFIFFKN
ncbi:RNA polymerase sigma factor [Mucilaginibacter lappiensis]|uniref:RNA polymerase sigma factor n=1 Tax=Mucilaginibacter lappiensis TaxID=354630 RepID=A0A1N7BPT9_9SPHI|nr:sigma-70 family RNA polymerase sigma factor [Mucilaginibacter lappiensis]MBB6110087.1 RNA polymerase sigma-70 factor (ECF subfamily) [Mucilaginibacter lappiensis]MBB6126795.1 RNA polymerase sigma-70 factor (ECF subfamily) [Mucilaginibacter lappiensis]SIR53407.1 RNA polymerase sigma-70 factor, ECF subfamily [Mucilaginibacter lappiensis]